MSSTLIQRLRERLDASGLSSEAASRAAGLSRSAIQNIFKERSLSPRAQNLQALARVLGTTVNYLLGETDDPGPGLAPTAPAVIGTLGELPVRGRVAAGLWREVEDIQDVLGHRPAIVVPGVPLSAQWLELVEGDSIDLVYPPGAFIHCVDPAWTRPLGDGDLVVLERVRDGGHLVERSVKQMRITGSPAAAHTSFWPRSRNPRWSDPLVLGADGDDTETRLVGIVTGGFIPAPGWE